MKDDRKNCGTCKWHEHENIDDGWVCVNEDSIYYSDWTEYNDSCIDWEGTEGDYTGEKSM